MKALKILLLILGLAIISPITSEAQYFIASYGVEHNWYLPDYVYQTVEWEYPGYVIAHAHRFSHHGRPYINLVLRRGNKYMEVRFNHHGHIVKRIRHHQFPLVGHVCGLHCGYHRTYYVRYPSVHRHHHHSHMAYGHKKQVHHSVYKSSPDYHHKKKVEPRRRQHNGTLSHHQPANTKVHKGHRSQGNVVRHNPPASNQTREQVRTPAYRTTRSTDTMVRRSTSNSSEKSNNQRGAQQKTKYSARNSGRGGRN